MKGEGFWTPEMRGTRISKLEAPKHLETTGHLAGLTRSLGSKSKCEFLVRVMASLDNMSVKMEETVEEPPLERTITIVGQG